MCESITKLFKYENGKGFSVLCCGFMFSFVTLVSQLSFTEENRTERKKKKGKRRNREYPVFST